MDFNQLHSIISESYKNNNQYPNLIVNEEIPFIQHKDRVSKFIPMFELNDILRVKDDPSRGSKMYVSHLDSKKHGWNIASTPALRRQQRRLNWVAGNVVDAVKRKQSLSLKEISRLIIEKLTHYQENILKTKSNNILTAYESRMIASLLLKKHILVPIGYKNNKSDDDPIKIKITDKNGDTIKSEVSINQIIDEIERNLDFINAIFETDLVKIIKGIIKEHSPSIEESIHKSMFNNDILKEDVDEEEIEDNDINNEEEEYIKEELPMLGVTIDDILNDTRIKNVFDSKVVREAIKALLKSSQVVKSEDGYLTLGGKGTPGYIDANMIRKSNKNKDLEDDVIPDEDELEDIADKLKVDDNDDVIPKSYKKKKLYDDENEIEDSLDLNDDYEEDEEDDEDF